MKQKELYSINFLEKKSKNIKISENEINNAKIWIEKLKNNELISEKSNYPLFVEYILKGILGYTINDFGHEISAPNQSEKVEYILYDKDKPYCVIELKGQKEDLWKRQAGGRSINTVTQALNYAIDFKSEFFVAFNYEKLLFFETKKGRSDCVEINFLTILDGNFKGLKILKALLSKESLIEKKEVEKISSDYVIAQKDFSKEFYKLFHETRKMLVREIEFNNTEISRKKSVEYAQKILDRVIFICFAEDSDRNLLSNQILEKRLIEAIDNGGDLWKILNELFSECNGGKSDNFGEIIIPKFNGGLFKESLEHQGIILRSKVVDNFFKDDFERYKLGKDLEVEIKNKLNGYSKIFHNFFMMASFDFTTEIDVNILGHIFENSLSDLEVLKDESISQRKKDGIFYTPEYITEYICSNTIIPYLSNKESKNIDELIDEFSNSTESILELEKKLKEIKILDPACGSGAFLNKAVNILLEIHMALFEIKKENGWFRASGEGRKKIGAGSFDLNQFNIENEIREIIMNNIYGVDLNKESVEITKLSLFLKVASKDKPLPVLDYNIKCGNSLISGISNENSLVDLKEDIDDLIKLKKDKKIEDYNAEKRSINRRVNKSLNKYFGEDLTQINPFNWEIEFAEIFKNGGFDVVIGNPPYVFARGQKYQNSIKEYFFNFSIKKGLIKEEKGLNIQSGKINLYGLFLLKSPELIKNKGFIKFIIPNGILRSTTYNLIRKYLLINTKIKEIVDLGSGIFEDAVVSTIILEISKDKSEKNYIRIIKEIQNFITKDYTTSNIEQNMFLENTSYTFNILVEPNEINILKKVKNNILLGSICKYISPGIDGDKKKYILKFKKSEKYKPLLYGKNFGKYFLSFDKNYINYDRKLLNRARDEEIFISKKILIQRISGGNFPLNCTIDNDYFYTFNSVNNLILNNENFKLEFILTLLNSRLINWFYSLSFSNKSKLTVNISKTFLEKIPIPEISPDKQKPFIEKAEIMLDLNKQFQEKKGKFLKKVENNLNILKISKKLDKFYELDFKGLLVELQKQKIIVSLKDQDEWEDYFEDYKKELVELKERIDLTDKKIDEMVYTLYGLTKEEIEVVEEGLK